MLETGESTWPGGMSLVVELQGYRTRPAKHWGGRSLPSLAGTAEDKQTYGI